MEDDAFSLETQSLFQAVFARERDLSLRAYNTMPRQPAGTSQCPNHLTGAAGKARRARDLAVGRYFTSGDFANSVADDFKHDALLCAIPGQCPAQPVFERILRIVAQIATRRGSVGLGIANVASPWRTVARG
jgi:hypothetical protein